MKTQFSPTLQFFAIVPLVVILDLQRRYGGWQANLRPNSRTWQGLGATTAVYCFSRPLGASTPFIQCSRVEYSGNTDLPQRLTTLGKAKGAYYEVYCEGRNAEGHPTFRTSKNVVLTKTIDEVNQGNQQP